MTRKRGGQPGNRNGAHDKPWTRALERHAVQNAGKLARLAEVIFEAALNGDMQAAREIGDRLDGKPRQSVDNTHAGADGGAIKITRFKLAPLE